MNRIPSLSSLSSSQRSKSFSMKSLFPQHDKFHLLRSASIPDYGISVGLYSHKQTGGELLSVQANDDNKVFGITFRTPPSDSTGVPHILEHSVLCGSRKYKSKEPFADLLKGSLNTFLNAFTYPDRTCYPVASMNNKDFYNLVDVYLDAVFCKTSFLTFPNSTFDRSKSSEGSSSSAAGGMALWIQ